MRFREPAAATGVGGPAQGVQQQVGGGHAGCRDDTDVASIEETMMRLMRAVHRQALREGAHQPTEGG